MEHLIKEFLGDSHVRVFPKHKSGFKIKSKLQLWESAFMFTLTYLSDLTSSPSFHVLHT